MDLSVATDLLIILLAGFLAGLLCKKLGISMLVGYLLIGALIGRRGLNWISQGSHDIERLAEVGVLLLLFSVGLELCLDDLRDWLGKFLIGGSVQMVLVAFPLTVGIAALGLPWEAAVLLGLALAFSSTVLVFRALSEHGETGSSHGRGAVAILLFQDAALMPLLLAVPHLTADSPEAGAQDYFRLFVTSLLLVVGVLILRKAIGRLAVPLLASLRSTELVILFMLAVLVGVSSGFYVVGFPPLVGALAAGLILGGNRLSGQIDALVLPFRESFAAIFFVSLGMLFDVTRLYHDFVLIVVGLVAVISLKWLASSLALRLTGLGWWAAVGTGLGLAQVGEFSFVLALRGWEAGVITEADYHRVLCLALGTLILTPQMLKLGLRLVRSPGAPEQPEGHSSPGFPEGPLRAVVVGIGVAGRQIASRLELAGFDVCAVDLSPVNLHPFAQQGFRTVPGDASDLSVLRRAEAHRSQLIVICVPDDEAGIRVLKAARALNRSCRVLTRCRFLANVPALRKAGANTVVSEEREALNALLNVLDDLEPWVGDDR